MKSKSEVLTFLRAILIPLGTFLIGKNVFGRIVDIDVWEMTVGGVITIAGFMWSLMERTVTIELIQTTLRQIIKAVSGFLLASGYINSDKLEAISSLVSALSILWYGQLSKKKTRHLDTGKIDITDLKK